MHRLPGGHGCGSMRRGTNAPSRCCTQHRSHRRRRSKPPARRRSKSWTAPACLSPWVALGLREIAPALCRRRLLRGGGPPGASCPPAAHAGKAVFRFGRPFLTPSNAIRNAIPHTPFFFGSQMNLCIWSWNRTGNLSATIQSTMSRGSMRPKIGENSTPPQRSSR